MTDETFKIQTENGEETARVIFTFDTDEYSYCIYSILDDQGEESEELFAARYELDENGEMTDFVPVQSEEEWEMVQEVYATLVDTFTEDDPNYFTVTDEEGNEKVCEVLSRFRLEEFGKQYVVYKFALEEHDDELFAASFEADENGVIQDLYPIESEEEWEKIERKIGLL